MGLKMIIESMSGNGDDRNLNAEWLTVHNQGDAPFNSAGCSISVAASPNAKSRVITTLKAGLVIKPGERVRLVSGSAGKKSQGDVPAESEGLRNFFLLLKAPYLGKSGITVKLERGQHELCHATFDPAATNGLAQS